MKRICIFVTYDAENIVDDYIGYLLSGLRRVTDKLIVVCNYEHIVDGMKNIKPYADKILYRKNIGFDSGGYKDAICQFIGWDEIRKFDELVLINDSFYGPVYPFEKTFNLMENTDADYWGITRAPRGKFGSQFGYKIHYDKHIQSYFIAFRKKVLQNDGFREFWEEMKYPETIEEAILFFEIGINNCMKNLGYTGHALTDLYSLKIQLNESDNPYLLYPLELIRDAHIPILKRKSLILVNRGFENALKAFEWIKSESDYNIDLICNHILRTNRSVRKDGIFDILELEKFYKNHSKIYIYGAGTFGKNLALYFDYKGWTFEGFVVTDKENQTENSEVFEDVDIGNEDGIIIAIGNEKICMEIKEKILTRCRESQIF